MSQTIEQHMRKLRASACGVVHSTPPECEAVHDWLCEALERARIAEEERLAKFAGEFKRHRLAQARNAA